jgi:hypothetical protein
MAVPLRLNPQPIIMELDFDITGNYDLNILAAPLEYLIRLVADKTYILDDIIPNTFKETYGEQEFSMNKLIEISAIYVDTSILQ